MAKSEKKNDSLIFSGATSEPLAGTVNTREPDYSRVKLAEVSLQDLIAYKKIADLLFEHYDGWAKSFIGEYDPMTKENYAAAMEQANFYRMVREAIRFEMETRLLHLDTAVQIWTDAFEKNDEETVG